MVLVTFSILNLLLPLFKTQIFEFTDYDLISLNKKESLRTKFLDHKKQNNKIILFDKLNSKNSLFINNILHLNDENLMVKAIEDAFRNMLAMKTVKYIFKRDFFWRTWRQVEMEPGNKVVICYKCQNPHKINCKDCHSGGYWVIEEKPPPCPYEIFSLITDQKVCVVNYTEYPKPYTSCPSTISVQDLKESCDNPIETKWRISKKYTDISKRLYDICQGRESCKISTSYLISPNSILFRITNSTNHIFYSRIMKSGNKNYACIDNCGKIDPKTKIVSKSEQPLRVNLLKKNKREDLVFTKPLITSLSNQILIENKNILLSNFHNILKGIKKQKRLHNMVEIPNLYNSQSQCKKIEEKYKDN